jgi:hypothetical protein
LEHGYTTCSIVNIYISGYDGTDPQLADYFGVRYDDASPFTPITNRIDLDNEIWFNVSTSIVSYLTYGGDCYTA